MNRRTALFCFLLLALTVSTFFPFSTRAEEEPDLSSTDIEFGHKRVFTMQTLKSKIGKYFTVTNYGSYLLKPFSDEQMNKLIESDSSILIGLTKMIELFQDFGCEIWVEAIV